MKSKKVLLGLFMGLFALSTGSVMAQTQGNSLIEVGPSNLGGRVRAVLVDKADTTGQTVYAGAAIGGLFYRDAEHDEWTLIKCELPINGDTSIVNLPITSMVQGSDNMIYIGTGEGAYLKGFNSEPFSPMGYGIVKFNPANKKFTQLSMIPNKPGDDWSVINKMSIMNHNGVDYLYVATGKGLYRRELTEGGSFQLVPGSEAVPFQDIELVEARNIAYFTSGNKLYKQTDMWANSSLQDISGTNEAFTDTNTTRIELAVAPSDPSYLYAMVFNEKGLLKGLYLTKNQQTWTLLNTPTITPMNPFNTGATCAALEVDNGNPDRIIMAGATIWIGEGFVENSYYQWIQSSYSELELNGGDYMAQVFSNGMFVHSGIHQIVPAVVNGEKVNYIATDGGVFVTKNNFNSYSNINLGLNTSLIVDIDVAPDGSLISGAYNNGCPFIQARLNHHGGEINQSWYDSVSKMNHLGNVTYAGNGGYVAASMFQQVKPQERRTLFVSSNMNGFARAYNDYNDYTQTQTWTAGVEFMSNEFSRSEEVPSMDLFETTNSQAMTDSIEFRLDIIPYKDTLSDGTVKDTLAVLINPTFDKTSHSVIYDTIVVGETIPAGSYMHVISRAHAYYPFTYTFEEDMVSSSDTKIKTHNPICNRMAVVGRTDRGGSAIFINWYPSDFSKVFRSNEAPSNQMLWARPFLLDNDTTIYHLVKFSNDGNILYATIDDAKNQKSYIVRITGLNDRVDYSLGVSKVKAQLDRQSGYGSTSTLVYDTVAAFDRMITSMNMNPIENADGMIVTFGGYVDGLENAIYINHVSTNTKADGTSNFTNISSPEKSKPAYSAMIAVNESGKGVKAFLGTENGLFAQEINVSGSNVPNFGSWAEYGEFHGVPVTAMCQQLKSFPIRHYTQHSGYNTEDYLWGKTKYPFAMYFGTYGRGIFMDSTLVSDHKNEIVDSLDRLDIPQIADKGDNSVRIYPNPAISHTNIELTVAHAGKAVLRVFDLSGKLVYSENMGTLAEGVYTHQLNCQNLRNGMYLINVVIGNQAATSKLLVR